MSDDPSEPPPVIPYRSAPDPPAGRPAEDGRTLVGGCLLTLGLIGLSLLSLPGIAFATTSSRAGPLVASGIAWAALITTAVGRGFDRGRCMLLRGVAIAVVLAAPLQTWEPLASGSQRHSASPGVAV